MSKKGISLRLLPLLAVILLCACSEAEETGEFDNWAARNQHYVDSIAELAERGADGWERMTAYNLVGSQDRTDLTANHYVYVKKMVEGTGTCRPQFNDSIRVHYLGRLIPSASWPQGYVFDKSYSGNVFNERTDVPTLMSVKNNVTGFATATMHMVEGDRWKLVIPYPLGYGVAANSSAGIPGYSALVFDVDLARVYRKDIDLDTTWH